MKNIIFYIWFLFNLFSQSALSEASHEGYTEAEAEADFSAYADSHPTIDKDAPDDWCVGKLSEKEKTKLKEEATAIYNEYLHSHNPEDLTKELAKIYERHSNLEDDKKKTAVIAELSDILDNFRQSGSFLQGLSDFEKGKKPSDTMSQVKFDELRGDYEVLKKLGIKYDLTRGQWDLSELAKKEVDLKAFTAREKQAMEKLLSPPIAERFFDPNRTEALAIGNFVVRPSGKSDGASSGQFRIVTKQEQEEAVKRQMDILAAEKTKFLRASKEANWLINSIRGRVGEYWLGSERGYQGKTAPEIERESALETMARTTKMMKETLGVNNQTLTDLTSLIKTALKTDSKNQKELGDQLDNLIFSLQLTAVSTAVVASTATMGAATPFTWGAGTSSTGLIGGYTSPATWLTGYYFFPGALGMAGNIKSDTAHGMKLSCATLHEVSQHGPIYVAGALLMGGALTSLGGVLFSGLGL